MSTLEMIEAAAERLKGHVRETPILTSPFLDEIAGRRVLVKPECLQHTGSFKFRGAWSAISALGDADRQRGVIAYSSGNHAQGVAYAAAQHGISSVIVMPSDAPQLKIDNTRALGGEVVLYDRANESREEIGEALASQRGLTLIRPYDEPLVIAGQGTVGLELARQAAEMGVETADVLVCCGGGGLTSGIALALEGHSPWLRTRPCEPQGFDDVKRSLATGHIQSNNAASGNICDAILTPQPGQITFPILDRLCGPGLSVSEEDALRAMAQAFLRLKIVLEPGGAVSLASALYRAEEIEGDAVIVVASGGNADPEVFGKALEYLT
ncbi:threonine/serine dehydratase [Ruegeria sp. A3M17]|uniref:threonine ammonia-lyase n=1 Tax=Ruegeria sp. A3M17 TaxID=2267229 RepID=UPI000DEBF76A|nr:threonine/serine dehydratase [Ruegeria sp. A3M17]RBW53065.1 threonine/serine dehydratase [Ruegeria sp. A3M17]